ncbi:MAG: 16S rRNA (cytidine(1402)-2'-O)-methyltransferase [Oligoflexia bacterium]|nr:16S rRNA (cytidine(1402)-2'-O)-methyltransferase [Oligoflexia bacterium]
MSKLILLGLPLGNIEDLSVRGKKVLESSTLFFAEDTRNLKKIFNFLGIELNGKTIESFHDHQQAKVDSIIAKIKNHSEAVIVSDAGSPIVSDPAYPLVKAFIEAGGSVDTVPGPTSPMVALELSGLPPHPFTFHGFLPRESSKKSEVFKKLSPQVTHIFFEGVSRVLKTLNELAEVHPDADVVIARELTKTFQTLYRFKASEIPEIELRGEFVLLIRHENSKLDGNFSKISDLAQKYLDRPSPKALAKLLGECLGENSKEIYSRLNK